MKVVFTTIRTYPFHGYGGLERYTYYLSKYLSQEDIEIEIYTSSTRTHTQSLKLQDNIRYHFIKPEIPIGVKGNIAKYHIYNANIAEILKNRKFDILHSFGMTGLVYLKLYKKRPVVTQPFHFYSNYDIKYANILKKILWKVFISYPIDICFKKSDIIASEGYFQTREIANLFSIPSEKFYYLPDGIEIEKINKYIKKTDIKKEDIGVEDADLVLININRLEKAKGVNYLIEALKMINELKINTKLILIGTGNEERDIINLSKKLEIHDKIIHLKNIPDKLKYQLINLADICVTPTLYEGLPIVILEALACGKPIVASDVSENPQAVKHRFNGLLVPPKDSEKLAKAIIEIYQKNLIKKMGKRSKYLSYKYDWKNIAKKAIDLYLKLI